MAPSPYYSDSILHLEHLQQISHDGLNVVLAELVEHSIDPKIDVALGWKRSQNAHQERVSKYVLDRERNLWRRASLV